MGRKKLEHVLVFQGLFLRGILKNGKCLLDVEFLIDVAGYDLVRHLIV